MPAIDVYNCWTTVPFHPAVATRLIQYWNDTLQFQSTLDYLKSPPPGYQQPAVDLIAALGEVQDAVDRNEFANEYQFEAALQNVLFSANDAHLTFFGGVLSSFSFGSSIALTSLSLDGTQLPKVYFTGAYHDALALIETKGVYLTLCGFQTICFCTRPSQTRRGSHLQSVRLTAPTQSITSPASQR